MALEKRDSPCVEKKSLTITKIRIVTFLSNFREMLKKKFYFYLPWWRIGGTAVQTSTQIP
jgi:hypothetical protein